MKVRSIEGNTQRLDGGAMFGNCPKPLWEKWLAPDDKNRIEFACRAMLVTEANGRNVLFETGIGAFFPPKLKERFGVFQEGHVLLASLAAAGLAPKDVDVVVLSHLHFDHAGGLLTEYRDGAPLELVFPRARYVVGARAWERATHPHARDRASFIPELAPLLEATGRLEVVSGAEGQAAAASRTLGEGYSFFVSEGHTPGLLLSTVHGATEGPITFLGDLVPGVPWVHLPITMGYDRYPERLIEEKEALLGRIVAGREWVFYTHDRETAASRVAVENGRYVAIERQPSVSWGTS